MSIQTIANNTHLSHSDLIRLLNEITSSPEHNLGPCGLCGVLATVDSEQQPHTRTVAIREISEAGVLIFTQKPSSKVSHLQANHKSSLTIWLPDSGEQITFKGTCTFLSDSENDSFWATYPSPSRKKFSVYGPISGEKLGGRNLEELITKQSPPENRVAAYIGFRLLAHRVELYKLAQEFTKMSTSLLLTKDQNWCVEHLVP